jgi:glucose/arabinose dehydrogenase/regulation of enolase protein 1 (concanavalin A-like superfamily)
MFRDTTNANSTHVLLDIKPGGGLEFMQRATTGGSEAFLAGGQASFPAWLKLVRAGSTFTAYWSSDGSTWTTIGTTSVTMASSALVGLPVCSHTTTQLATAVFDSVTATAAGGTVDNPPAVSITSPTSGATFTAGGSITITANATDTDATPVASVAFYANNGTTNALVGTVTSSPYTFTWTNVAAGSYSLTAVATDTANLSTTSAAVPVTVNSTGGGGGALPSPWTDQDIGSVGLAGSATYNNGTFTVQAAGADIWGTTDSFNYVDQSFPGDGQIIARVDSLQNTNSNAKAGVMFRETSNANAVHVLLDIKPGGGLEFMQRATTGGSEAFIAGGQASFPAWLKLVRSGSTFAAYWSTDGNTWTTVGTTSVTMAASALVGLPVCAHTTTQRTTAVFDSVTATAAGGTTDNPPAVAITSPTPSSTFTAGGSITITANATDSDATTVASVAFYANNGTTNTLIGTDTSSPYTFTWANVAAGSYSLTAVATDTANQSTTSAAVPITVSGTGGGGGGGALPTPWADTDIGNVGLKGSASYNSSTSVFTVSGSGSDIWGTADSFNFVYQALTGDGQVTARVTGITNTNYYAKAGVQIRQSLSPTDASVTLDLIPNGGGAAGGGLEMLSRTTNGGSTVLTQGAVAMTPMWLKLVRRSTTITAYVSSDGNGWSVVNSTTIPTLGGTVYVGLAVCSHDTTLLNTSTFDHVSVAAGSTVTNPITFNSKVLAATTASGSAVGISNLFWPTVVVLGPDGRLYVSNVNGRIFALTLDQTKLTQAGQVAVTNVQEIDAIYNHPSLTCNVNNQPFNCQPSTTPGRQVTGMTFDPASTASNLILYVSNSNFSTTTVSMAIDTYSGTITRLVLQPGGGNTLNVTSNQDLVVGLPRSRESHATNGLRVGPDGWLYIAQGGNTNAGQPSSYFLNLPEYYLGASVLRLNLAALPQTLPIDMHNATASTLTPYQGVFEIYSTGYRNPYDLAWHSNGNLFINVNSPNQTQGLTPSSGDGCPTTPSIDVGTPSDYLRLVTKGSYGGHPNPARGECVWGDGTVYSPSQPTPPNYVAPAGIYVRGWGDSSNGITEYKSNAFSGAMQGNLITATYDTDNHVRRVVLGADGKHVNGIFELPNTFTAPVSVCVDVAGNIYVADLSANQIVLLIASSPGQ